MPACLTHTIKDERGLAWRVFACQRHAHCICAGRAAGTRCACRRVRATRLILAARPIVRGLNLRVSSTIRLHHGRGFRDRLEGAHDRASPGSLVDLLARRGSTTLVLPLLRLVLFPLIVRSLQLRGADALLGQHLDSRMDLWEAIAKEADQEADQEVGQEADKGRPRKKSRCPRSWTFSSKRLARRRG